MFFVFLHRCVCLSICHTCRFERWRREIRGDLNMQLDAWTAEVMGLMDDAEAALSRQVRGHSGMLSAHLR